MATSVFSQAEPTAPRAAGTQASLEDVSAMLRGTRDFLSALAKVFPNAGDDELLQLAVEIEGCPAAVRLLHTVFELKKIKV